MAEMKFDPAAEPRTASLRATHLARKKRIVAAAIAEDLARSTTRPLL